MVYLVIAMNNYIQSSLDQVFIPFLELDLGCVRPGLSCDELFQVADGVVRAAFYAHCVEVEVAFER